MKISLYTEKEASLYIKKNEKERTFVGDFLIFGHRMFRYIDPIGHLRK